MAVANRDSQVVVRTSSKAAEITRRANNRRALEETDEHGTTTTESAAEINPIRQALEMRVKIAERTAGLLKLGLTLSEAADVLAPFTKTLPRERKKKKRRKYKTWNEIKSRLNKRKKPTRPSSKKK